MTKFKTSDISEQSVDQIDVEQLDAVVGGANSLPPSVINAINHGWTFKDVFAKPNPFSV